MSRHRASTYDWNCTLANRGTTTATAQLTYTPATFLGASGGGIVTLNLPPGHQVVETDTMAYLAFRGWR